MAKLKKILITTGEHDGIGLEIAVKALCKIGQLYNVHFVLFASKLSDPETINKFVRRLSKHFKIHLYDSLSDLFETSKSKSFRKSELSLILSKESPALWVEESARACLIKKASCLVTGPLSKPAIISSGLKDIGHTDILKRICKRKNAFMAFLGQKFNVILATGHIPVSQIEGSLSPDIIRSAIREANMIRKDLSPNIRNLPMALLGLNPHAGDSGLIGDFESRVLLPEIVRLQKAGYNITGPIVPDVAFGLHHRKKYSLYIALYHDQGLIPFKMAHGFAGVHLTLGLPIWRTSVDHGTAKDLFGQNKADCYSMLDAIRWSVKLSCSAKK